MLILLISIAFLLTTYSSFTLGFQILTLNRVVVNTPITIAETSVIQQSGSVEENMLFNRYEFEERIGNYYEVELSKFSGKYNLDFYYFADEDFSICMYDDCPAVLVKFEADLLYQYHFERILIFRVAYHYYEL